MDRPDVARGPFRSVHVGRRADADTQRYDDAWSHAGPRAAHAAGAIALLQDFALLKIVIRAWIGVYLEKVDTGRIDPRRVDWLLCHYSARSLRQRSSACWNRRAP